MTDRYQKRKQKALLQSVVRKAKLDMEKWILDLPALPTEMEIRAFQSGYIAGINRGSSIKE